MYAVFYRTLGLCKTICFCLGDKKHHHVEIMMEFLIVQLIWFKSPFIHCCWRMLWKYSHKPKNLKEEFSTSPKNILLFKNRITSPSCTFYYVICLFISHFHSSSCLSTRHLSCNLYHNNIFLRSCSLLLGVNKKQYGKWVYWIKLGIGWEVNLWRYFLQLFLLSLVLLMRSLLSSLMLTTQLHEKCSMTLVTKLPHVMTASEIENFN